MRNKVIFSLVVLGAAGALASAYVYAVPSKPQSPVFQPAPNPYPKGIYANGIVESYQANGENINIYPEVSGSVVRVLVAEGQRVTQGTALLQLDDSVQRATAEQLKSQAEAAKTLLDELRAQPRKENLEVARAQVGLAQANLKSSDDQLAKQQRSYELDPESVSKDALDNATNAQKVANANLDVVTRQYELMKAGAWRYDVKNQEKQADALGKAYAAATALLAKYTVRAPGDGIVMSVNAPVGSYLSPQGVYDTYTEGFGPAVVMGTSGGMLAVRCYIDEILIPRLPAVEKLAAQMFIRGTNTKIALEFVRVQPYVSPKIQLSNQRQERVDLRVLPIIFKFQTPENVPVFPGELVDVYVGEKAP
ncbi:MAG TPA: biotin/lipoyl-binding protein [Polyangiaceae bacterium]|nr:biotin/lipoyl-binding protein [Polyangiaceae bacterium]